MNTTDNSLIRLVAMYFSPFALPRLSAPRKADRSERRRVHRLNMLHFRPFLRRYIFRSGQLVVVCFVFALLFSSLLPFPLLALAACAGILLSILHTVLLIFMQQSANDIASRSGPGSDEKEG